MNTEYKNSSVVIAGVACLAVAVNLIERVATIGLSYEDSRMIWRWVAPIISFSTPILFAWIGILLRKKFPNPKAWVKALILAIIPASYLLWTLLHANGIYHYGDGDRCLWIYSGILGFMIPPKWLESCSEKNGWVEFVLFLASAFCYWGITRVENHFSVINFQMLENEWTRLFCRMMRFIPLAMSVFFLSEFSFSRVGQRLGSRKAVGWTVQILAIISFMLILSWFLSWRPFYGELIKSYRLLSQPVAVYLLVVAVRIVRRIGRKDSPKRLWADIF